MEKVIANEINISAPGKIILFGEHSVVYGRTALAFSLGLRTTLNISPSKDTLKIFLPDLNIDCQWPISEIQSCWDKISENENDLSSPCPLKERQITEVKKLLPVGYNEQQNNSLLAILQQYFSILTSPVSFCLILSSNLPSGGGLGSSAAFSVCISAAFIYLNKMAANPSTVFSDSRKLICDWSIVSERLFHGKPSGIDNSVSTYGGAISFTKGNITLLKLPVLKIVLISSGVSRSTKNQVSKLRQQYELFPSVYESIFTAIHNIANTAISTLNVINDATINENQLREKYSELSSLVSLNQGLLSTVRVSHPCLEEICKIAQSHGFIAKLTGAGGGGFAFTIIDDSNEECVERFQTELKYAGFSSWVTKVNGDGVALQ